MHKTGSSAIQEYLAGVGVNSNYNYTPYITPNHCGLFALLTHPDPAQYHGFKKRGMTEQEAYDEKIKNKALFIKFLKSAGGNVIFSAEDIALSPLQQIRAFHDLVGPYFDRISVYIYVRPPKSYVESAFQQLLKEGDIDGLKLNVIWPSYTSIIGRLDQVFGRDNVNVEYYYRPRLHNKSVVDDFVRWIGAGEARSHMENVNSSLSAEAIALLFLQRKLGSGLEVPSRGVQERNARWIELLASIGEQKFSFSDDLIAPWLENHKVDLMWLERRVGSRIPTESQRGAFEVSGPEDLLNLATENSHLVEQLLLDQYKRGEGDQRARLIRVLEALRAVL